MRTENLTILFVDIAGYTATTNRQSRRENAFLIERFDKSLRPVIRQYHGKIIKTIGDAFLLTFRSPTDAMLCAKVMQDCMVFHNRTSKQPITIRVAAHLGEVRIARQDIFGEPVNLTARIESITPPGQIYLSEAVYLAMNKTEVLVSNAGGFELEGFAHQVHLYQVQTCATADDQLPFGTPLAYFENTTSRRWQPLAIAAGIVLAIGLAGGSFWYWQRPIVIQAQDNKPLSEFIQLTFSEEALRTLPAEIQFGIRSNLLDAIQRLPGFYESDEFTASQTRWQLEISLNPNDSAQQLQLLLSNKFTGEQMQKAWQFQPEKTQSLLRYLSQQFTDWLSSAYQLKPLPANWPKPIPDELYNQWLKVANDLQQATDETDLKRVLKQLDQLPIQDDSYLPATQNRCDALVSLYQMNNDRQLLKSARKICPKLASKVANSKDWFIYGRFLESIGDTSNARQAYENSIARDPKLSQAYSGLARLLSADGQVLEAQRLLQQAINLQPGYWRPLHAMAVFQLGRGQFQESIANYKKIVELTPKSSGALNDLGAAYYMVGELQLAADSFAKSLLLHEDASTLSNLASLYYFLGRLQEALTLYLKASQLSPDKYELNGNLADCYRHLGDLDAAKRHYQIAIELINSKAALSAREQALYGYYSAQIADFTLANEQVLQALRRDESNPEIQYWSALIALKQQQKPQALSHLQLALQLGYPVKLMSLDPELTALASDQTYIRMITQQKTQ